MGQLNSMDHCSQDIIFKFVFHAIHHIQTSTVSLLGVFSLLVSSSFLWIHLAGVVLFQKGLDVQQYILLVLNRLRF